ncbi:MAG: diphosphate--fructose-6-phosphate 1-phosphotransferase [Treponema sp.]|nr:MAG: diphosphate--fructose-6-phosphate 1-phosphotransferase [Treponema sp.]
MNFLIEKLGECSIKSPLVFSTVMDDFVANYVKDSEFIHYDVYANKDEERCDDDLLERAGPRRKIFFEPKNVHAAIATCGGLCPGLNDVIRALVRCLDERYGVKKISGIKYGYKGLIKEYGFESVELNSKTVDEIHKFGGTVLGTSRGGGTRTAEIVDTLEKLKINMLFLLGGDGTLKGAGKIAEEVKKRSLNIAVVGIPKTIDNDIAFIEKSFGFDTAVGKATEAVAAAHTEASSQINGVGLIQVMGRESGFIAAQTAIASHSTDFVLIPEVPFELYGKGGLLSALEKKLAEKNHAVILVAEGAGQNLLSPTADVDASGNKILADIGLFLKSEIKKYFKEKGIGVNMKYIDPSYQIRASQAAPIDSVYCERLGNNAAHAAMAGKTGMIVALVHGHFAHLPIKVVTSKRKKVDPEGALWRDTIDATGQPILMVKNPSNYRAETENS